MSKTSSNNLKAVNPSNEITIAVSLRALFNLENYNPQEDMMPNEGPAFPFVKALKVMKSKLEERSTNDGPRVNIIITIPKADRVNDQLETIIQQNGQLMRYDNNEDLFSLLKDKNTKLYLSMNPTEVTSAITQNIAAGTLFTPASEMNLSESQLRVAFDGDGVIFSDEAEIVMKTKGLEAFLQHERGKIETPLPEGPLKSFLEVLVELQNWEKKDREKKKWEKKDGLIRTFLVTSRDALDSGRRALNTLRSWNLNINEMYFLEGSEKGPILQAIKPHIFFDDQMRHINSAKQAGVIAAQVPYGIAQQYN